MSESLEPLPVRDLDYIYLLRRWSAINQHTRRTYWLEQDAIKAGGTARLRPQPCRESDCDAYTRSTTGYCLPHRSTGTSGHLDPGRQPARDDTLSEPPESS